MLKTKSNSDGGYQKVEIKFFSKCIYYKFKTICLNQIYKLLIALYFLVSFYHISFFYFYLSKVHKIYQERFIININDITVRT